MEVIQQELKEPQAWVKPHANNMTQQIGSDVWELQQGLVPTFACKRNTAAASLLPLNPAQNISCGHANPEPRGEFWETSGLAQLAQYKPTKEDARLYHPAD